MTIIPSDIPVRNILLFLYRNIFSTSTCFFTILFYLFFQRLCNENVLISEYILKFDTFINKCQKMLLKPLLEYNVKFIYSARITSSIKNRFYFWWFTENIHGMNFQDGRDILRIFLIYTWNQHRILGTVSVNIEH